MSATDKALQPLSGWQLWAAAMFLSMANLIAILDMTIANVSVLTIAGGLAVTPTQGTWVITSYAVAEAITVPLTGWFTQRYGSVKVFVIAMAAFGIFSGLAGLSSSLGFLVFARILQGMAGGPLMPLSQTLLLRIFPKEKAGVQLSRQSSCSSYLGQLQGSEWYDANNNPITLPALGANETRYICKIETLTC